MKLLDFGPPRTAPKPILLGGTDGLIIFWALSRNLVKSRFLPSINCPIPDNIVKMEA
jgi:hypothetical protein